MSNHEEVRTYFKMTEISRWLGISPFEILINLISFFIFSIFLTLTIDGNIEFFTIQQIQSNITDPHDVYRSPEQKQPSINWFKLFSVLYCADILNAYFCFIVILRMFLQNLQSTHKLFWSLNFILLTSLFKYLVALKLTSGATLEWTEVCSPVFVMLQLLALRACQIKNS